MARLTQKIVRVRAADQTDEQDCGHLQVVGIRETPYASSFYSERWEDVDPYQVDIDELTEMMDMEIESGNYHAVVGMYARLVHAMRYTGIAEHQIRSFILNIAFGLIISL